MPKPTLSPEVLDTISHGVRTPLMVITSNAQLLGQQLRESELVQRSTRDIARSARRILQLFDDLADFHRVRDGLLTLQRQPTAIRELLQGIAEEARTILGDRTLELELARDLPPVQIDAALLARALRHLLENAAHHSGGTDPIVLRAVRDGGVRIEVSDHGRGIGLSDRERVFEPFVRLPGARGGVGLGLFLVRGYLEAMGGRVEARGEPGRGCTIAISLPVAT